MRASGGLEMFWCKICSLSDQDTPPGWKQVCQRGRLPPYSSVPCTIYISPKGRAFNTIHEVNMFLKKCRQAKKRRKRSKIEEETKVETGAKRLKAFNLVEKSFKLGPKSASTESAQKIPEGDACSKTDSSRKPKSGSKAPPLPPPAWLVALTPPPLKRKGPG